MTKSLLDTVLDPRQLSVRFQPIFNVQGEVTRIDSLEALIRGPRATNFERADLLFDYVRRKRAEASVDRCCFMAICEAARELPAGTRININVHASTLGHNPGFVEFFGKQAKKHSLALSRFTVEIVEHSPCYNVPGLTNTIADLREAGVQIALDDVGLGHSNFRMMLDCDPDYFKLDAYFVRGVSEDRSRRAVVESVLSLARATECLVVAEGVESPKDLSILIEMGVPLVQANLLCAAMPLEDLQVIGILDDPIVLPGGKFSHTRKLDGQNFELGREKPAVVGPGQTFYH
ncbi:MAG TPA: EAL domain-containing protein [Terriglobales bacterium]|jgi:EAL domain-containing protein (putative c-di-GMP-specific phosphodiesterase class I)|nr:EAL domain-containing protein [Terriglobales bacterium]